MEQGSNKNLFLQQMVGKRVRTGAAYQSLSFCFETKQEFLLPQSHFRNVAVFVTSRSTTKCQPSALKNLNSAWWQHNGDVIVLEMQSSKNNDVINFNLISISWFLPSFSPSNWMRKTKAISYANVWHNVLKKTISAGCVAALLSVLIFWFQITFLCIHDGIEFYSWKQNKARSLPPFPWKLNNLVLLLIFHSLRRVSRRRTRNLSNIHISK